MKLVALATCVAAILIGCSSSDKKEESKPPKHPIQLQSTRSNLFFGETNHQSLSSLKNISIFDPTSNTLKIVDKQNIDIRYPVVNTAITKYDPATKSYEDLHTQSVSFIDKKAPKYFVLEKSSTSQKIQAQSKALNLEPLSKRGFSYKKINYLGLKQFLIAKKGEKQVLIPPNMSASDDALDFENKTLFALSFKAYGEKERGYIVYDKKLKELQECSLDMKTCTKIKSIDTAPIYLGDILGTAKGIFLIAQKPFKLDKTNSTLVELALPDGFSIPKKVGHGSPYVLNGNDIYTINKEHNIFKYNTTDATTMQLSSDGFAHSILTFTDSMLIYGGDQNLHAVAKDGSNKAQSIELSIATKTKGHKYPFGLATAKHYLYNTFSLDKDTGKMNFFACKLENQLKECKPNSFWSAITAAKSGTMHFNASFRYTPRAYIRVDNTDQYGGGIIKAVNPQNPMSDGLTMGTIENYNFQSFLNNSSYGDSLIDSDGYIILYAKNDVNFKGDAFLMNLDKENSLKNITNEKAPTIEEINGNSPHCHGRYCTICHSFSGGKVYIDKAETKSALGYTLKFLFEDRSPSVIAKIRKGKGENFNTTISSLVGKRFKVIITDKDGEVLNHSSGYNHRGAEYFNCNFCHARKKELLKHDAPSVISVEN